MIEDYSLYLVFLVDKEADLEEGDEDEEEGRRAEATLASVGRRLDVTSHHLGQAVGGIGHVNLELFSLIKT